MERHGFRSCALRSLRLACAAAAGSAWVAHAHHSISAVYDGAKRQRIEGVVTEFQFVNPHPFVIVGVDGAAGTEAWRLELDNRFELVGIGMTAETLKPGDRIVATGSLGRVDARSLYVRELDRPSDGFRYEQIGSRPRVSTATR